MLGTTLSGSTIDVVFQFKNNSMKGHFIQPTSTIPYHGIKQIIQVTWDIYRPQHILNS